MKFWWVNHKITLREEITGGFLWSPKTEANGAQSQFYNNMKKTRPGDLVISYANAMVSHVGIVSDYAVCAPKPLEFGSKGDYWQKQGWLLAVSWQALNQPLKPKEFIAEIKGLFPSKYSPINPATGYGNQKAYLAEISHTLFEFIIKRTHHRMKALEKGDSVQKLIGVIENRMVALTKDDPTLSDTEKDQLIMARVGQGAFRSNVFKIEGQCRVTKINNPTLLIASHIKPWRACSSSLERLDGANGLTLAPHVDHLFDRGLITFDSNGMVLLAPSLASEDLNRLGLSEACQQSMDKFTERQAQYMAYHRQEVFLGG